MLRKHRVPEAEDYIVAMVTMAAGKSAWTCHKGKERGVADTCPPVLLAILAVKLYSFVSTHG